MKTRKWIAVVEIEERKGDPRQGEVEWYNDSYSVVRMLERANVTFLTVKSVHAELAKSPRKRKAVGKGK